ncbi:conserved hypothetical protein [Vibrio crassostreae]|nr:conserved hypothetical protein [Vibrio crassostreae]CAK1919983.1 conserved hypothetical protein [Vibrio crassostreae]CAK1937654.1 conserved hypothetical protein [Vibrio crassostreae]CAK1941924.1 conserved hypothetical protein [Vibrio crassostreae]CAK2321713.1 conserved hypothetical protein [Vibrio crassostreae]
MGTSTPNKGPNSNNPLVPTWLEGGSGEQQQQQQQSAPKKADIKPESGQRFRAPRSDMNRYFRTGDTDSMKRGISRYVKNTGGKGSSVKRMGGSTKAAGNLLSFLTDAAKQGADAAAKNFNLTLKPNETADQLLLRVSDKICEVTTSNIPDAVVRSAYIETVIEMTTTMGITDLSQITSEQISASLSCFIGKSVTERIINDIGNNVVAEKANPEQLHSTLKELGGYIEGCASDAMTSLLADGLDIMDTELVDQIDDLYANIFEILESVGDE